MRLVIQRVKKASVTVVGEDRVVGSINKGLLVLVGISKEDTGDSVRNSTDKLAKLRIMADEQGKMNLNLKESGGRMLIVSQFTLYADISGGNRPSFIDAADPSHAEKMYKFFIDELGKREIDVETGQFGSYMKIEAELDGPVTIIMEK